MDKVKELEKSLINLYIDDNSISGIFISGSLSNDLYDEYSDVDIRFIIKGSNIGEYLSEFETKIQNLNHNVLFIEPCYFSNALIPHFDNFIKADVFFYTKEMLVPSAWLKDIKIVKDQDDFLYKNKLESQALNFLPNYNSINKDILKFFASSHECFRRIMRSEFFYADYLLDSMKLVIINFNDYLNDNMNIGWYKVEKRFDKKFINMLSQRITDIEKGLESLTTINKMFLQIEKKLCHKLNMARDLKNDLHILTYYIKEHNAQ